MKLFRWMQSKFSADKRANAIPSTDKNNEALNEWPNGLLSIGTFGYTNSHDTFERRSDIEIPGGESEECRSPDFTAEEVRRLQKELTKLLRQTSTHLPLDRFLNCPSSLQLTRLHSDSIDRTIQIILRRCKDACQKKTSNSLCSLINKMFVCGSGFASTPTPSFKGAFHQVIMKTMIINPPNSYENQTNGGGFKWDKTDSDYIVLEI